jgi:hypothetical protein
MLIWLKVNNKKVCLTHPFIGGTFLLTLETLSPLMKLLNSFFADLLNIIFCILNRCHDNQQNGIQHNDTKLYCDDCLDLA